MLNKFPLVVKLVQGYKATYFMPEFFNLPHTESLSWQWENQPW